jgi:hypothetical protein
VTARRPAILLAASNCLGHFHPKPTSSSGNLSPSAGERLEHLRSAREGAAPDSRNPQPPGSARNCSQMGNWKLSRVPCESPVRAQVLRHCQEVRRRSRSSRSDSRSARTGRGGVPPGWTGARIVAFPPVQVRILVPQPVCLTVSGGLRETAQMPRKHPVYRAFSARLGWLGRWRDATPAKERAMPRNISVGR